MKKLFALCSLFSVISFAAIADEAPVTIIHERSDDYVAQNNATIQILDKQAGKVQTITVPINKKVQFNKLEITIKKCLATNEFLPEDFFMFVEVKKSSQKIFSGWMTKSDPGQNPLQDADNDLWLVKCD